MTELQHRLRELQETIDGVLTAAYWEGMEHAILQWMGKGKVEVKVQMMVKMDLEVADRRMEVEVLFPGEEELEKGASALTRQGSLLTYYSSLNSVVVSLTTNE